ncbi:TPA: hypothetical protein ACTUNV_001438 [Legionella pneumophila]|uniref:hypothetical protein n=1 Tax=Legionella sp. PATHC039 TaxID=2992042 RepID=UPI0022441A0D|nr:hypothetical protein [Legionella sp. PATHC039]MCW8395731.1 hypothetical protein [Legionella sp. PATHC039]
MVFSFEEKVEKIEPKLFLKLAKNIEVESNAWAQLIGFIEEMLGMAEKTNMNVALEKSINSRQESPALP